MDRVQNTTFLEKLKKRKSPSLKVEAVYLNSKLEIETIDYLKKQKYLNFLKIDVFLKNNFSKDHPFGYVLKNSFNGIVGFLGTMFSSQTNNNKDYILCNLHTWIVDKSYRLNSYLLIVPLMEIKCAITTYTPVKTLIGLYEKLGFKKINTNYRIVFLINLFGFLKKKMFIIEENESLIKNYLNKNDMKIHNDHAHLSCKKFLLIDKLNPSNACFIIAVKKKIKYLNTLDLVYVSNNLLLKKYWLNLCMQIALKFRVSFCSQSFLDENECSIPNNILISKELTKEICVKNLPSEFKFNSLYSEFVY